MIVNAAKGSFSTDNRRGPKRKEIKGLAAATVKGDNSSKAKGFNGVWVNSDGKYFIKIEGKVMEVEDDTDEERKDKPLLFDSAEAAAKQRDQILKDKGRAEVSEMNYKPDGSRIIHKEKAETKPTKGDTEEAGRNVIVPALANIDIKVCTYNASLNHSH